MTFNRVKKSSLIIGIVDRIKIILIVSSSGMDKSSSATCLLYSDVVKVEKKSGRGRRRSRDEKGTQGVGDFRFINILQLFSFTLITLLYNFFLSYFQVPTTFTHTRTHEPHPRPTTFSYTLKIANLSASSPVFSSCII